MKGRRKSTAKPERPPPRTAKPRRVKPSRPAPFSRDEVVALKKLATTFTCITAEEFFLNVAQHLARNLKMAYTFIGELLPGAERVRILGGYSKGKLLKPFEYELLHTPCEQVAGKQACCIPTGVQELYPKDALLKKLRVDSYIGTPLFNRAGKPLGIMVAMDTKPLREPKLAAALFNVFTDRTEAEIERQQAEAAILRWKNRHEILAAATGQIVYELNRTKGTMRWSPTARHMLGLTTEELDNQMESWERRLHPEDRARVLELHEAAESRKIPFSAEYRLKHKKGAYRWFHDRGCPLPPQREGEVIFVGAIEDITRRRQMEAEIRERTQELDRFFGVTLDMLCIATTDGYFRRLNAAWERSLGYRCAELENQRILDFVHPEDIPATLDSMQALSEGRDVIDFTNRFRRQDGFYRWLEWRSASVHGNYVYAAARDITARKETENALEIRNRAIECAASGIFFFELNGTLTFANASGLQMLGYGRLEDVAGQHITHFGWEESQIITMLTALREQGHWAGEVPVRTREGSLRFLQLSGSLVRNDQHEPVCLMAACTDITLSKRAEDDRLRLERKIQQAQKLESLAVLAGGIAHDFNNILTAVLGNISLALMDLSPVSPAREQLVEAEKATGRAADLVKQMLAYSGKGRFVVQRVDLREVVKEMAHMLEASISRQVSLRQEFTNVLPAIEADVNQLRQVIVNLVVNASEAITAPSGVITLVVGAMECDQAWLADCWPEEPIPEGTYVYLDVIDTGGGIAPELMTRIFDPFFSTKFTGRGLGLAAVLGIMRGHKGAIKVRSEPGKGSVFRLLFPASAKPLPAPPTYPIKAPGRSQPAPSSKEVVLLVDDEATIRQVGRKCLERLGFPVLTATSGAEAIAVVRNRGAEIKCVLLDLRMPGMDGRETFQEMRRLRPDLRIFFCTGYDEETVKEQLGGQQYDGVIRKPFSVEQLQECLGSSTALPGTGDPPA